MLKTNLHSAQTGKRFLPMLLITLVALMGALVLSACGDTSTAAQSSGEEQAAGVGAGRGQNVELLSYNTKDRGNRTAPPVTVVATRTASPNPVSQQEAITALTTWNSQTLGISPTFSEAKGLTNQVVAEYDIPSPQKGIITANINGSRASYGGKIQGGGYSILHLGGGSTAGNENLSVQIKSASLGYTQLPATSYPASGEAALSQLKQAFPNLAGYTFTPGPAPKDNKYAYIFYATTTQIVPGKPPTKVETGVTMGYVKIGDKVWTYAMVGTGTFANAAMV